MLKKYLIIFESADIAMEHIDPKLLWLKMHITLHVTSVTLLPIFLTVLVIYHTSVSTASGTVELYRSSCQIYKSGKLWQKSEEGYVAEKNESEALSRQVYIVPVDSNPII